MGNQPVFTSQYLSLINMLSARNTQGERGRFRFLKVFGNPAGRPPSFARMDCHLSGKGRVWADPKITFGSRCGGNPGTGALIEPFQDHTV